MKTIFLSHLLDQSTPSYGNRERFRITQKSSIARGDSANGSEIQTNVHMGTHIDLPWHFYEDGPTIEEYDAPFWIFNHPLFVEIKPKSLLIEEELIDLLEGIEHPETDILCVKTGMGALREENAYWEKNYGFSPKLYPYLTSKFPQLKVFGFDCISVTSFAHRDVGKVAHRQFLNPSNPILLLEDMNLDELTSEMKLKQIIVSPLRIAKCDGLPCTVFGMLED